MPRYAPEYTTAEKLRLLALNAAWGLPLVALIQFILRPWLGAYIERAHCDHYLGYSGLELVFYGLFTLVPLVTVAFLWVLEGRNSLRVFKLGQYPLPGRKVLRPTAYVYGAKARRRALIVPLLCLLFLGAALYGVYLAQGLLASLYAQGMPAC